jgi:hypothetical protein
MITMFAVFTIIPEHVWRGWHGHCHQGFHVTIVVAVVFKTVARR